MCLVLVIGRHTIEPVLPSHVRYDGILNPTYSVTKRIDFCYGHRLLEYDGVCKHPHGHNAVAEIEVRTDTLDNRNMVCDFSDIKRIVKGRIDPASPSQDGAAARRPAGEAAPGARRADLHRRQQLKRPSSTWPS